MNIDKDCFEKIKNIIPQDIITIIKPPHAGLLMMTVIDSFDTTFYLGEILVTGAEVQCNGQTGYAMVIGDEPERALLAASVEAILQTDNEELKIHIRDFLSKQMEKINSLKEKETGLIEKTRVFFENMPKG